MGVQAREKARVAYKTENRSIQGKWASGLGHEEEAARHYVKAGQLDKAIQLYEKYGSRCEEVARESAELGKSEMAESQYGEATKAYRNAGRLKRVLGGEFKPMSKPSKLEMVGVITAIIGVVGGLFFLSYNLTGNVIGSLNQNSSNWIGGVLFLIGLVGAFVYFRRK